MVACRWEMMATWNCEQVVSVHGEGCAHFRYVLDTVGRSCESLDMIAERHGELFLISSLPNWVEAATIKTEKTRKNHVLGKIPTCFLIMLNLMSLRHSNNYVLLGSWIHECRDLKNASELEIHILSHLYIDDIKSCKKCKFVT